MLSLYIGNKDKNTFKVIVLNAEPKRMKAIEPTFDLNEKMLHDLVLALIESQLPIIDETLNKGIKDPLIE